MKKALCILISALLFSLTASMPVGAAEDNRSVTVSTEVSPAYIVTIPTDTTVFFNVEDSSFGSIELTDAKIEPGKCVSVALLTDHLLKNKSDKEKVLPFQIHADGQVFEQTTLTNTGDSVDLSIHIDHEDWNKAYAGEYENTIIFQIVYATK